MKVLIIGSGRMGIRHATGALDVDEIQEVVLMDAAAAALENAKVQLASRPNFSKLKTADVGSATGTFDFVIDATTAADRVATSKHALSFDPKYLLIEKPLGQSLSEIQELVALMADQPTEVSINLNMRLYDFVNDLKRDLNSLPQFEGPKQINFQGGTIGIGANGIHYLDLLFFLFDADRAELVAAEIDPDLIPSGRGASFGDLGGWAVIKFYGEDGELLGRSFLSLSSTSSVFGGWEIIGRHGRIRINELENERIDILRKADSEMPINRYAADYLPPSTQKIESPPLSDLTRRWIETAIRERTNILPDIRETLRVHELMFNWLSHSKSFIDKFPIT